MELNRDDFYSYYRTLHHVAKTINSSLSLPDVLNTIVETVPDALGCKACSIRLLDDNQRRLLISAASGLSDEYLAKGPVQVDKSGIDQQALEGQPVVILDVARDSRFQYPEEARKEGISSVLVVPLTAKDQKIGVMRVYAAENRVFSPNEIDFLAAVGELSALAIQNARVYLNTARNYENLKGFVDALEGWSWMCQ
jgi:GAF domain-containing protein